MITLQHIGLYVMILKDKVRNREESYKCLKTTIPWLLLPDAIRAYFGTRQPSHFEQSPYDKNKVSWMKFPTSEVLAELSAENAKDLISSHLVTGLPNCVIGEQTNIGIFDQKNYDHPEFHTFRIHLLQDCALDKIIREDLVDVSERFDGTYSVKHNSGIQFNGAQLRKQIAEFETVGFLHLAGKVYNKTGLLLNQEWFEKHVYTALLESDYPKDLAENTYRYMKIPDDINERICKLDFELTKSDIGRVIMAKDLKSTLDKLYAKAYTDTWQEL